MENITFYIRDCNGNHSTLFFKTRAEAYEYLTSEWSEDYEVLAIILGEGAVLYSGLRCRPLYTEDLIGYFA